MLPKEISVPWMNGIDGTQGGKPPRIVFYLSLYEELRGIDFAEPLNDPMFRDFMIAKKSLSVYSKPFLSPEEVTEREKVSKQILEKIKEKFKQ